MSSYIKIGTPQPSKDELDKMKRSEKQSKLPIYKQEVFDQNGRQRLHGAFQGGFSAGYYNTVGSKEGWTPNEFKSSRNQKAVIQATPYDFMDEEDIQEFGGRDTVEKQFDELGSTSRELEKRKMLSYGSDLLTISDENIGKKMMVAMGYNSKKNKVLPNNPYQKYLDLYKASITKSAAFGRGFDPLHNAPEFKAHQESRIKKPKQTQRLTGFGTGIFDDDNDDIEAYDTGFSKAQNYSDIIDDDEELTWRSSKKSQRENPIPTVQKTLPRSAKSKSKSGVIEGFVIKHQPLKPAKIYLAPLQPPGFKPCPTFNSITPQALSQTEKHSLLNDTPLEQPSAQSSIFSFISLKNQQRLNGFINRSKPVMSKAETKEPLAVFTVPTKYAKSALKGFMPFGDDPPKQKRYVAFLEDIIRRSTSDEEVVKIYDDEEAGESREFSKAAMLYRPLSEMISNRFVNEAQVFVEAEKKPIVFKRLVKTWKPCKMLCRRFAVAYHGEDEDEDETDKQVLNPETMKILMDERDKKIANGELGLDVEEHNIESDLVDPEALLHGQIGLEMEEEEEIPEKPSMDLFKAIFEDSDASDVDENQDKSNTIAQPTPQSENIPAMQVGDASNPAEVPPEKTAEEAEEDMKSFRPQYVKPTKRTISNALNKPRKKKTNVKVIVDVDYEEQVEQPKIRPCASDYM